MVDTPPVDVPAVAGAVAIALRPMTEDDLPFLRQLHHSIRWDELAPTGWPDEAKLGFLDQQFSFQHRQYVAGFVGAAFSIVLDRGEPIGRFYVDRTTRNLHVIDISLLPEWRGRGLGTALLTGLQDEVRAGRFDRIGLSAAIDGPARRLYERLGFVPANPPEEFPGLYLEMVWPAPAS
jgi:ribosomal protein S18 acetylase RimI-like enzyme